MKDKKNIDAVKMMREIRYENYLKYKKDPELRDKRLAMIREKYKGLINSKQKAH